MRRAAVLLAVLFSCRDRSPVPAPAPPPPDAGPDERCRQQVAELAAWMGKLAAAGRVELDFSPHLVDGDLPAAWLPEADVCEIRPDFRGCWDASDGLRDYMSDNLADRAALDARLLAVRKGDAGLRVDIARDEPWAGVVELADAAAAAGYTRLHIVFRAPSPVPAPTAPPPADRDEFWKGCAPVRSYWILRVPGDRSLRELAEDEARAVPAALLRCACAVDVATARAALWSLNVGNGTHRAAATLTLAPDGAPLRQPRTATFAAAAPAILEAARAGRPVRLYDAD